jgi:hypothetical protein
MGDGSDGDELTENVVYRTAYGEAYRVAEGRGRSFASGRDRVRDVQLEARAMTRDIGERLGVEVAKTQRRATEAIRTTLLGGAPPGMMGRPDRRGAVPRPYEALAQEESMPKAVCPVLMLAALAVLAPRAVAVPIVTLSSPSDLTQLTVGDTARIDVNLQGLSTNEFIFILNTRELFPASLFEPVPDPNNSSGLTPGTILSPTLGTVSQVARFNELSSLTAGAATGNFQDFPNSAAIGQDGLYYSFTLQAIAPGSGVIQFDPTGTQYFSNQSSPPNTLVPLPTGGPLPFTITAGPAAIPEPSSVAMVGLMTMAGLGVAWRRRRAA